MSERPEAELDAPGRPAQRPLIQADRLSKVFRIERGLLKTPRLVHALDGVSLQVLAAEVVGVVGQSASGKTSLAALLVRRLEPTFGRLLFDGEDFTHAPENTLGTLHRRVQLVAQDCDVVLPYDASVRELVHEPLAVAGVSEPERDARTRALLDELGLEDVALTRRVPDTSLGERQRLVIARSLALDPDLVVCDDALSSLDATAAERVIAAFERRRTERGTAFVLLSNDLGVVRRLARRVLVLYAGRVIERGGSDQVFASPLHPYTRFLAAAEPGPDPSRRRLAVVVDGAIPSSAELPPGCPFHPRCPRVEAGRCDVEMPQLDSPHGSSHSVACFHPLVEQ